MERNIRRDIMAFNSNSFLSYVTKSRGLAEGFRFEVSIPTDKQEWVRFMCQEAMIPGVELEIMEKKVGYGPTLELPKTTKTENVSLKFLCTNGDTEGYPEWNYFHNWISDIANPRTHALQWKEQYQKEVLITTSDRYGVKTHITKLTNAYPIKVGDITLGSEQKTVEFETTLSCDYAFHNKQLSDENVQRTDWNTGLPQTTQATPEEKKNPEVNSNRKADPVKRQDHGMLGTSSQSQFGGVTTQETLGNRVNQQ